MISSDKNIDIVMKIIDALKEWVRLKTDYLKLDAAEKSIKIISALLIFAFSLFFIFAISVFLSLALAFAICSHVGGMVWAMLIVAGLYLLGLILLLVFRKPLLMNPITKLFSALLAD